MTLTLKCVECIKRCNNHCSQQSHVSWLSVFTIYTYICFKWTEIVGNPCMRIFDVIQITQASKQLSALPDILSPPLYAMYYTYIYILTYLYVFLTKQYAHIIVDVWLLQYKMWSVLSIRLEGAWNDPLTLGDFELEVQVQ